MAYDFGGSGLVGYSQQAEEEVNPIMGVANLADIMLVFSCGLMLALVSYWNLDLPSVSELQQSQMQEVTDVQQMDNVVNSSGSGYSEVGTVYQDPNTGKLYMMKQTDDGSSSDSSTSGGTEAAASGSSSASAAASNSQAASSSGKTGSGSGVSRAQGGD